MFGKSYAEAWVDIMVGYKSHYKNLKGNSKYIKYTVGTPMGLYSSWSISTFCHHFVLYICCRLLNRKWSTSLYKLLGDDIVIWDSDVALKYQEVIELLGVKVNAAKTFISSKYFEFAKRYFTPIGEISPFSYKAINSSIDNISIFYNEIINHKEKGWIPVISASNNVLQYYDKLFPIYRRKSKKRRENKVLLLECLYKRLAGHSSDAELVNLVLVGMGLPTMSCNFNNRYPSIIRTAIIEALRKCIIECQGDTKDRIYSALIEATGPSYCNDENAINSIYNHPFTYIVGEYCENSYIELCKTLKEYENYPIGEIPLKFDTLVVVDTTRIMQARNYEKVIMGKDNIISALRGLLRKQLVEDDHFPGVLKEEKP